MPVDLTDPPNPPKRTAEEAIAYNRSLKAQSLVDILWSGGWTHGTTIPDRDWLRAEQIRLKDAKNTKQPSDETKRLTVQLLEERWKGTYLR